MLEYKDYVLFTLSLHRYHLAVTAWTLFGLTGNALFSARVLVQWFASERAKKSVVPVAFWWMSVAAALVQLTYALGGDKINNLPFMIGLVVTMVPYIRSLTVHYRPDRPPLPMIPMLIVAIVLTLIPTILFGYRERDRFSMWLVVGFMGTLIYTSRFFIAWIETERLRRSTFSLKFWWSSLIGSILLLIYSLSRHDIVFILSFLFNGIPYVRNIMLINRAKERPVALQARN
ncbi:lipid-A-disaccharide synthase N-terminal domain-containing protein [bacterium]|nr:lipid-A-disaccharide synthase N-terminal domain-containing protein [bacterium]